MRSVIMATLDQTWVRERLVAETKMVRDEDEGYPSLLKESKES